MKEDTELQEMLAPLTASARQTLAPRREGDLALPGKSALPAPANWRGLLQKVIPRPESALWLMFTDLVFFADSIPFLWPFLVVPGFVFGAGGVLAVEKLKARDRPEQCLIRALLAGALVALPTPILGTLSGAVALMVRFSGWSPNAAADQEDGR